MILRSITLRNFRQHADSRVEFPESGIIGLLGANGSGKSTMLEAVAFALYGTAAIRGKKADLRWYRATGKREAEVSLTFEVGGRTLRVFRTESDAKLWQIDGPFEIPIAAGISVVDDQAARIVGMRLPEFRSTYMAEQRDLSRIASMQPIEREKFFREVLGVGRIDRALKACRDRKNALGHERDGLAAGLGEREPLKAAVAEAQATLCAASDRLSLAERTLFARTTDVAAAQRDYDAHEAKRIEYEGAQAKHRDAVAALERAQAEVDRLSRELDDAHEARARVKEREGELEKLPALRMERDRLLRAKAVASEIATLEQSIEAARESVKLYERYLADCDAAIAAHDPDAVAAIEDEYRETRDKLRALTKARDEKLIQARRDRDTAAQTVVRTARLLEILERQGEDGACPTCEQKLGQRFADVHDAVVHEHEDAVLAHADAEERVGEHHRPTDDEIELDVELEGLKERGQILRQREKDAQTAREKRPGWEHQLKLAQKRIADGSEKLASLGPAIIVDTDELARVEQGIAQLEQLDRDLAPLRGRASRIDTLQEQRTAAEQRASDARGRIDHAADVLAAVGFDAAAHAIAKTTLDGVTSVHTAAKIEQASAATALSGAQEQADRADAALARYDERAGQLEELTRTIETHERAAARLDAFRRAEAATIRPELEELTTGFVALLTDGRYDAVSISESFDLTLYEGGVPHPVVSGGTEDIASLALRLAVSQMIAERAGHPLSLLVLDEPFGSLDEVRRGNVLALVRRLAGVFQQTILISHVEETKTAVDHAIEVTYGEAEGRSYVHQSIASPSALAEAVA